jgi:ParB-like chromosome segregation protein Spo0J
MSNTTKLGFGQHRIKTAFLPNIVDIELSQITVLKNTTKNLKNSKKYQQILQSIVAIGLVEPLVIFPDPNRVDKFLLLDGHLRFAALEEIGTNNVQCLVGTDDDTYTYNKRINRLASVQSIRMIIRAVNLGVSPEDIAKALNLSPVTIRSKFNLLDGICDEAIKILADQEISSRIFHILKKMKPLRQIATVDLMKGQQNFTVKFAGAILLNTLPIDLVKPEPRNEKKQVTSESIAQLEREIAAIHLRSNTTEDTFSQDALKLTIIKGYLTKILGNLEVVKWLATHQRDYLLEFQKIAEMAMLPE